MEADTRRTQKPARSTALIIAFAIVCALAFGLWARPGVDSFASYFTPERHLNCLPDNKKACVGSPLPKYANTPGRVQVVICRNQPGAGERDDEGHTFEYLFFPEFIARPCTTGSYLLVLEDSVSHTVIDVQQGTIKSIVRGPLHVIDL